MRSGIIYNINFQKIRTTYFGISKKYIYLDQAFVKICVTCQVFLRTITGVRNHGFEQGVLLPSGKGKHPLLMYKNFTYNFKVVSSSAILWHCSRRNRTGCKAFVRTLPHRMDCVVFANNQHCHTSRFSVPRRVLKPAKSVTIQQER